jgi:hypothetical protein
MSLHRSTAYVKAISDRFTGTGPGRYPKYDPITSQFRFIVRLAHACHLSGTEYDLTWKLAEGRMAVSITAIGHVPDARPIPKPPKPRPIAPWKPAIWDGEYRLDAYHDATLKRLMPGFVIAHSCGLSLVHPSESGELGVGVYGADEDIRANWLLTHSQSGRGFGLGLSFKRAVAALELAASFGIDWTQPVEALQGPEFRRAGYTVLSSFGSGWDKSRAIEQLRELEVAA